MERTLVAMAVPKQYIRSDTPLSSQFEGDDYERIKKSSLRELLKEMVDDGRSKDDLEAKMERNIRNLLEQSSDSTPLVINCYNKERKPIARKGVPDGISSYEISDSERVSDYIFQARVDGKDYDTIDMVVHIKPLGGSR